MQKINKSFVKLEGSFEEDKFTLFDEPAQKLTNTEHTNAPKKKKSKNSAFDETMKILSSNVLGGSSNNDPKK
jgi:hypothetical protein